MIFCFLRFEKYTRTLTQTVIYIHFTRLKMRSGPNSDCRAPRVEKGGNVRSRGELVHFQLSRIAPSTVARSTPFSLSLSLFRRLRDTSETRSRHQFSPCCHSRAQIFRLVRRISIYLIYMFPTSRRRRWRIAQLNTIRSVLVFFLFFFAIIYGPRARGRSTYTMWKLEWAFLSFRVIAWLRPIKAFRSGRYRSSLDRRRRPSSDLLHWFRRIRVDLTDSRMRGSSFPLFRVPPIIF